MCDTTCNCTIQLRVYMIKINYNLVVFIATQIFESSKQAPALSLEHKTTSTVKYAHT